VFIEAANTYYSFDYASGFWKWLCEHGKKDSVGSIREVLDEIKEKDDACAEWAKGHPSFFAEKDPKSLQVYVDLTTKLYASPRYPKQAVGKFLQDADAHLIAHAAAHGHTLVTREVVEPKRAKIKIPDVAKLMGVTCIQPWQLFRKNGLNLVQGPPRAIAGQAILPNPLSCCGGQ